MIKLRILALGALTCVCACFGGKTPAVVPSVPVASLPGHDALAIDTTPKEGLRMVPPEAYVRTYLQLFGGLAPLEVQKRARGADGPQLFDTWADYLATLGFPDDKLDLPRATQTNALMIAAFERLGAALCDRAMEHDRKAKAEERVVFAFDGAEVSDLAAFEARFDVLHRTFLGYPAKLAPNERTPRFYKLFTDTVARHAGDAKKAKLSAQQTGWAVVCEGLVRHPEFHLY